jgi:hypothetical protein
MNKEQMISDMEAGNSMPEDFGLAECPNGHGYQKIKESGSFTGFAGGTSYFAELECGDMLMDESDDLAAAR